MPHIKVLPVELRNRIAAGEVIERPASVVKELVENAIDAGSTEIIIEVLYGGKRMIKVSDNGSGMDREDAFLCLEPHATSKLSKEDDLFDIRTLGFRGEALPSIASVSKVTLVTGLKALPAPLTPGKGPANSIMGVSIEISGGETGEIRDSPFAGTSIEVRDLFFNMPARKKFLKTDNTELYHIIDTVTKEALSHYGIGFNLLTDSHETMILPRASGYRERIMQIYGEEFLKGLMEVGASGAGITMKALVSVGSNFRNSKAHQYVFINSRPVKDQALSHAVYKAYEGIMPTDKHPVFFLFLDIDPKKIDVNVHPTKREVRFPDKETIYKFIYGSIRDAVKKDRVSYAAAFGEGPEPQIPSPSSAAYPASPYSDSNVSVSENTGLTYRPSLPSLYLGDTFIAVAGKGGLTLIDHHAAHERILYEKFLRRLELKSHHLLFPEQLKLTHKEYRVILEKKDLLIEFGIELDDFGHDTLIIRALPDAMTHTDLQGLFSDIAAALLEGVRPDRGLKESIAARIACHASVRGKDILNQEELSMLLADLENTEHPDQCPHGRPTRIFYTLDDLKKMFRRK